MQIDKEKSGAASPFAAAPPETPLANGLDHGREFEHGRDMDQVRELLFGETKRTTEKSLKALENKVEELTAAMNARFAEVMALIAELRSETERSHASAIDEIGGAIAQLGANVRNIGVARKPK